jgi:4-hydroxy-3-polyprenylbenzoate decarboxylase
MKRHIVVAVTGASGTIYAVRLVEVLLAAGCDVHLTISAVAADVLRQELDLSVDLEDFAPAMFLPDGGPNSDQQAPRNDRLPAGASDESNAASPPVSADPGTLHYYHYRDYMAPIASGSFLTDGMVVCPCSGGTLGALVHGTSANLIHRAAEVHLKERRRLILVPRETPLSLLQLGNLKRAAEAGAIVLPAMPAFYHGVNSIRDLVNFVVSRICDQLAVPNNLIKRWGAR